MAEQIKVGVDTGDSLKQLNDMAQAVNAFTQEVGKAAGKQVRLLDVTNDIAELKELLQNWREVINAAPTLRGAITTANTAAGRPSSERPATPMQLDQSLRQNQQWMHATMVRLMTHNASRAATPASTGLAYNDFTGRFQDAPPGPSSSPINRPAQNDNRFSKIAQSAAQGLGSGGVVGGAAASFARGAGQAGDSGLGVMGMLKGGGIAALAYGAYQAVSSAAGAVSDKMDAGKQENIEIDKFKRSLGVTSESFETLKNQSRHVGEQFNLAYEQSRKLTTEFANMAKVNAPGQAGVGVDLAQATGVDESQGVGYMASMRKSGSLGEKTNDAKLLAIQFAEALKRTGSALNSGELMHAISGFASATSQRSLNAPNTEGYAGMLSALVGSGAPGLKGNVGNAAAILNHADAAFQGGGSMGEASKTLQYHALDGNNVGLLGVKMRQAAGMFATGASVFGDKDGAVNTFLGKNNMTRFGGNKSGIEQVLEKFANSGMSKEAQLLAAGNHFQNMNPEQIATLMNLQGSGRLTGMTSLMGQHPELKGKFDSMSGAGYMALSDVQAAGGDAAKLSALRGSFGARAGLTDEQKGSLSAMAGLTGKPLQDALVKFTTTLEREKTLGEQAQKSSSDIAQSTARMADLLIPAAQDAKNYLAALVERMAPDTEAGRALLAEKKSRMLKNEQDNLVGGTSGRTIEGARNDFHNRRSVVLPWLPGAREKLDEIDRDEIAALGPRMPKPGQVNAEMRKKMRANDAALRAVNPAWPLGLTEAQIGQESSFNPNSTSVDGARGYAQFLDGTRQTWEKRTGKKFDPKNFDDSLELHRLQMAENLKSSGGVDDALRMYHGGTDRKRWGKNNDEYVPKIRDRLGKQGVLPVQLPAGNPAGNPGSAQPSSGAAVTGAVTVVVRVESANGLKAQVQDIPSSVVLKPKAQGTQPWRSLAQ